MRRILQHHIGLAVILGLWAFAPSFGAAQTTTPAPGPAGRGLNVAPTPRGFGQLTPAPVQGNTSGANFVRRIPIPSNLANQAPAANTAGNPAAQTPGANPLGNPGAQTPEANNLGNPAVQTPGANPFTVSPVTPGPFPQQPNPALGAPGNLENSINPVFPQGSPALAPGAPQMNQAAGVTASPFPALRAGTTRTDFGTYLNQIQANSNTAPRQQ